MSKRIWRRVVGDGLSGLCLPVDLLEMRLLRPRTQLARKSCGPEMQIVFRQLAERLELRRAESGAPGAGARPLCERLWAKSRAAGGFSWKGTGRLR
jgi:hypothetical protein